MIAEEYLRVWKQQVSTIYIEPLGMQLHKLYGGIPQPSRLRFVGKALTRFKIEFENSSRQDQESTASPIPWRGYGTSIDVARYSAKEINVMQICIQSKHQKTNRKRVAVLWDLTLFI